MNHVLSVSEYSIFDNPRAQAIKEALIQFSLQDTQPVVFESFENQFILSDDISSSQIHERYVLSKYDNLEEINENESLLLANYYSPELLSQSGKYESTVNHLKTLNEGVISTITSALSSMTEGGSFWGVVQFCLDIIGIIPGALVGIPVDMAANLLNGIIYAVRDKYLLSFLSFISLIDLTKVFTPFKAAIKGLTAVQDFFAKLWKGAGFGRPAAEALLKTTEAVKNRSIILWLGKILGKVVRFLSTIGLKFLKSLVSIIVKAVDMLTLGVFKLDKYIPMLTRGIDTMIAKLTGFCTEAEAAIKVIDEAKAVGTKTATTSADAVSKAAKNTADKAADKFAKKTGKEMPAGFKKGAENASNVGMTNKLGKVESFADEVYKKSEAKFGKLFPNVTNPGIKKAYAYNDAAKELVENIFNKKAGLLSITKNPKIMREFAQGNVWKGADKILSDAIRRGDPTQLSNMLTKMIDDPEFFKLISRNSPDVAKTMMTFKNAPEALIIGARNFKSFGKWYGSNFKLMKSLRTFPTFLLKVAVKTTECGQYLGNLNSSKEVAGNAWDIGSTVAKQQYNNAINEDTINMLNMASVLDRVYEQTTDPELDVSQETLEELKRSNPAAYQALITAEAEATRKAKELKDRTNSKNPCLDLFNIKQAEVGVALKEPKSGSTQMNVATNKVVTNMTTPEDFKKANAVNYTKNVLNQIGEPDATIEAQHPLHDQSPVVKAYFSNVVTIDGEVIPSDVPNDVSRLDKTLDSMIASGMLEESDRARMRAQIIDSWNNDTVPKEVEDAAKPVSAPADNPPNVNESKFKIGKLTTVR